ncbi:MAG: histidine triad (HIT) family protein [Flavobacteriales bacterium]|jgi:histidine triad (HIT) family protein
MGSIFSKIISGELSAFKIAEDDRFLAFLDVFPIAKGHVLVIPKMEIDSIFELPEELYKDLWSFAKEVAKGMKLAIECTKIGISVIGLEVPHAHIHLIPMNNVSDMDFSKPKLRFEKFEFEEVQNAIKNKL